MGLPRYPLPASEALSPADVASLNLVPQPIWIMRARDGQPEFFNTAWCELTGTTVEEGIEQGWLRWISPEDHDMLRKRWAEGYASDTLVDVECRLLSSPGEARWHRLTTRAERDGNGRVLRWYVSGTDIHEQKTQQLALEYSSRVQQNMLNASVDCIKIIDLSGNLTHMNSSGCRALLGDENYSGEFGMPWLDLLPPEIRKRGQRALDSICRGKTRSARFSGMSALPGCKPQHWDNLLSLLTDAQDNPTAILCVSREVTLQRETENRLRITSDTDSLTSLLNRRAFTRKLKRLTSRSRQTGKPVGLLLTDLDHFKSVNDTLGHPAGDHLLRVLSGRLKTALGADAIVARLGGDEFAIAVENIDSDATLLDYAQQVLSVTDGPITFGGHELGTGMSIGCAVFPRDAQDVSGLLKCADTALNDLKAGGRGGARLYNEAMRAAASQTAQQLKQARQLVRDEAVFPCYIPRVDLRNGRIVAFQARLQWQTPSGGLEFSDALETAFTDYHLATSLSRILYDQILTDMARCLEAGRAMVPVTFRARMVEFLRDELAEYLLARIHAFNIPPSLVELEITEQALSKRGSALVTKALTTLKAAGVRIMLGSFGTGQSSLIQLGHYPVDMVKMDASLIQTLTDDVKFQAIVQALVTLTSGLSLGIVADDIQTEEQRQMLERLGCPLGQGPLLGALVTADGMMDLLQDAA